MMTNSYVTINAPTKKGKAGDGKTGDRMYEYIILGGCTCGCTERTVQGI